MSPLAMLDLNTLTSLLRTFKYVAMFGVLFLCGVGLPLPEEVTLIASGLAVGWDWADFWFSSVACVLGILAGDSIIFAVGRYKGRWLLSSKPMQWILPKTRQERIHHLFARHGRKTVFFARFLAGVRIGVYAYAGQHGMSWFRFLLLDLLGALISGPTSIWVGAFAARKFADPEQAEALAKRIIHQGSHWIYVAIGALILIGVLHWLWSHRSRGEKNPQLDALDRTPAADHRPELTTAEHSSRSDPESLRDGRP